MNNTQKCSDFVTSVMCSAADRFKPLFYENNNRYAILFDYCDAIDELIIEFGGEIFDVSVNEIDMTVCIELQFSYISVLSNQNIFYELLNRSVHIGLRCGDNDSFIVSYTFPSIFDRVS